MSDPIIEALGPYGDPALRTKLLKDNFFFNRCLEQLVADIALRTYDNLNHLEREALVKRMLPPKPAAPLIEWGIINGDTDGKMFISAKCGAAEDRLDFASAERLYAFRHPRTGEHVPEEIIYLWILNHAPKADPEAVAERRRLKQQEMEAQQRDQNRPRSPEELEAARAISKLPTLN